MITPSPGQCEERCRQLLACPPPPHQPPEHDQDVEEDEEDEDVDEDVEDHHLHIGHLSMIKMLNKMLNVDDHHLYSDRLIKDNCKLK